MVLVALALMGGMPAKSRAGNAMKPPPPATELSAPAKTAAENSSTAWLGSIVNQPSRLLCKSGICFCYSEERSDFSNSRFLASLGMTMKQRGVRTTSAKRRSEEHTSELQ